MNDFKKFLDKTIEVLIEQMLTPQPASIHVDVDKEGHAETSMNGRVIDLHFVAALINKMMIERGPMPIDDIWNLMK